MAKLDGMQRSGGTPRTVEQYLHCDSPTSWNDPEDYHFQNGKKVSVIAKVKEKAKKWRQHLAKKKYGYDGYTTPSWGVALEDYEVEEENENFGFQAKISKDDARQNQLLEPYVSDKRFLSNNAQNNSNGQVRQKLPALKMNTTGIPLGKSQSDHLKGSPSLSPIRESPRALSLNSKFRESNHSPSRFSNDKQNTQRSSDKQKEKLPCPDTTEKVGPSETDIIEEKEEHRPSNQEGTTQDVIDENTASQEKQVMVPSGTEKADDDDDDDEGSETFYPTEEPDQPSSNTKKTITKAMSEATYKITSKIPGLSIPSPRANGEDQKYDKGVSIKEYFKHKLEPGEDEKALSQVITEVISPRRSPTDKGVVEKVRAAVSMLLQSEELEQSSTTSKNRTPSQIPISTNAYEVEEEENQGRILQAN